jgi:serine/threonine protein kinase
MTQTQQHCSTPDHLLTFLRGQLSSQEESELQIHLNDCVLCRERLENAAADADAWNEAKQFFGNGALHGSFDDSNNGHEEATQGSQRIRQVLDALGPTDDPESLGRIGGYEVTGVVGAGGMGVVLKAHDRSLDRVVAVKVMSPHLASSGSARKRFAREAKAAAAVLHPNVIAIHSVASEDANPFLVMPYVRGASLQKRIDSQGPLPLKDTLRIAAQIAAGLAAAHEQGLVHRDIKPANILLEEGVERVTITDFGLARAVDDASMTCSGVIAGTPQYMSPEQTRGEPIDARSDLFSLGSVLYAMCAGRSPFRAETTYGVLHRIASVNPTPVCDVNSDVPEWLGHIIERLMAKRSVDRFESAAQVAELLEGCLAHVQQPSAIPLPAGVQALAAQSQQRSSEIPKPNRLKAIYQRIPPFAKYTVAAAFAFSLIFAGILIVLELDKGTLTIESQIDDVPIRIMQGDDVATTMTLTKGETSVQIASGTYVVEIDGEFQGIEVQDGNVTLRRRGENIVRILQTIDESNDPQTDSALVTENVRHLMEHIANPAMDELLNAMTAKPAAKRDWETIKSKALTISEVGNLLIQRGGHDQLEWMTFSESLRDNGKLLFEAANSRDAAISKTSLAAISESCTNCHRLFRNPPNASVIPIGALEKVEDRRKSSNSSPSHFTQRTLSDDSKRVQQITVDGESAVSQELVLTVEATKHNEQPTLAEAAAQFNQQSAEDRRKLFDPPIPDLTEEQLREGFRQAAIKYRLDGESDIAATLDKIVETGSMPSGVSSNLVASAFESKDVNGDVETKQIVPGLIVTRVDSSHRLVLLQSLSLRYRKDGESSKDYGDAGKNALSAADDSLVWGTRMVVQTDEERTASDQRIDHMTNSFREFKLQGGTPKADDPNPAEKAVPPSLEPSVIHADVTRLADQIAKEYGD